MGFNVQRLIIEEEQGWRDKGREIPPINFPYDWLVKIVLPYGNADVRFLAKKNNRIISVYYDSEEALGFMGEPYWEIYPDLEGDTQRFVKGREEEMIGAMEYIFENQHLSKEVLELSF